ELVVLTPQQRQPVPGRGQNDELRSRTAQAIGGVPPRLFERPSTLARGVDLGFGVGNRLVAIVVVASANEAFDFRAEGCLRANGRPRGVRARWCLARSW